MRIFGWTLGLGNFFKIHFISFDFPFSVSYDSRRKQRQILKHFYVLVQQVNNYTSYTYFLFFRRLFPDGENLRNEPKHIVFLTQLLMLFRFCHSCKAEKPEVTATEVGSMAVVKTICNNPTCSNKETVWKSQPLMPGTKISAGNFLLCFAILIAGGSASKTLQIFKHMKLSCISLSTFFKQQRVSYHCLFKTFDVTAILFSEYKLLIPSKKSRFSYRERGTGRSNW